MTTPHFSRDDFRRLAHDIRNALSVISMNAQILEISPEALDQETQKKLGSVMEKSALSIHSLLEQTLDRLEETDKEAKHGGDTSL